MSSRAQDRSEVARARGSSTTSSTSCPSIDPQGERRTVTAWDSTCASRTRRRRRCSTPTRTNRKVRSRRSSIATAAGGLASAFAQRVASFRTSRIVEIRRAYGLGRAHWHTAGFIISLEVPCSRRWTTIRSTRSPRRSGTSARAIATSTTATTSTCTAPPTSCSWSSGWASTPTSRRRTRSRACAPTASSACCARRRSSATAWTRPSGRSASR